MRWLPLDLLTGSVSSLRCPRPVLDLCLGIKILGTYCGCCPLYMLLVVLPITLPPVDCSLVYCSLVSVRPVRFAN